MPQLSPLTSHFSPRPAALRYNSLTSTWLSVDPLSDKYPNLSPYVYCGNNPVKYFDPNGEEIGATYDTWKYNIANRKLEWVNDEGGNTHQTIMMVSTDRNGNENISQTVDYDGQIGEMFDFSIISKSIDQVINGTLDIVSGTLVSLAGTEIGIGGALITGGASTVAGCGIFIAGATQVGMGLKTVSEAFLSKQNEYTQQNMVRDICKAGADFTAGVLRNPKEVKNILRNTGSFGLSLGWSAVQLYKTRHPQIKGIPKNAMITR